MHELRFCQSCGMPLDSEKVMGTNGDDSLNQEYCIYCFKDGAFVSDCTMQEMIEISLNHMRESGILKEQNRSEDEARDLMNRFFPDLKRWKR